MRQRGRHRRRRRGRALRAFLAGTALALTAAATMISASQATVTDDGPGALKRISVSGGAEQLSLTEEAVPQADLDRLAAGMGRPVGVSAVLAAADGRLRGADGCTAAERGTLPVSPTATRAYCWNEGDTEGWQPGAVTTSGDADDDGVWGSHRVILSGWSRSGGTADDQGLARVAFVDADDLGRLTYTWVLLAVPVDGGRDYRGLVSHVSGMVWYQDKLLVTTDDGDSAALYVYDMNRVQRATVTGEAVGRVSDGWSAHGYRFMLPAVGSYRLDGAPHPTTVSLDRSTSPDSLVAGEWTLDGGDRTARLWRYPFSTAEGNSGLLAADADGRVRVSQAYETKLTGVRGVLSYGDAWYVSRAAGAGDRHGTLWRQTTTSKDEAGAAQCGADASHNCWSTRTESLSYWAETGEVWTQSGRMLFATPLASIERAAAERPEKLAAQ